MLDPGNMPSDHRAKVRQHHLQLDQENEERRDGPSHPFAEVQEAPRADSDTAFPVMVRIRGSELA